MAAKKKSKTTPKKSKAKVQPKKPSKNGAKKASKKSVKKSVKKTSSKKPSVITAKKKTYVAIVLDKSGSMSSIKPETIDHFNQQIENIRSESQDLDVNVSLTVFDENVIHHAFNQPIEQFKPLTANTYKPSGSTAMLDAVGGIIDRLENEGVERLQATKRWTFTYLGANQDLSKIAKSLHIPQANVSAFIANPGGMRAATSQSVDSSSRYLQSRRAGIMQVSNYYDIKK